MQREKAKKLQEKAYPLNQNEMGSEQVYRLGTKKIRAIHSKNPYKIKKFRIPEDDEMPKKRLDGFLLLKSTKNEFCDQIIKANLSKMNIIEVQSRDLRHFINISELDISENEIEISDLVTLQHLEILNISMNNINNVRLTEDHTFQKLQEINLSYNQLFPSQIEFLSLVPNLRKLSLESNDLKELPETMARFNNLENFNLANNIFISDYNASNFWHTLASIKKLKILNLSRNGLRGIHTEKLVAGNFLNLEQLDFSYNAVENQHNLICARNFRKLNELEVTGNPFGIVKEHKGLEMEVYARTGAKIINDDIEKPYLNKKKEKRPSIKFDHLIPVPDELFLKDRNYLLGVQITSDTQQDGIILDKEETIVPKQETEEITVEPTYLTENVNIFEKKQEEQNNKSNSQDNVSERKTQHKAIKSMNYNEFVQAANESLADNKEYDNNYDLNTAYRQLNIAVKKQDHFDYKNFETPHYLKQTKSIPIYKKKDHTDRASVNLDSVEINGNNSMSAVKELNNQVQSDKKQNNSATKHKFSDEGMQQGYN